MGKNSFYPEEFRKKNDQDRMWHVEYWANYVKTHPDGVWSKQQDILINSLMENAKKSKLTREQYLKIKGDL